MTTNLRFRADPGQATNLRARVYLRDRSQLLATITSVVGPSNPFVEEVSGSYVCAVSVSGAWYVSITFLDTGEIAADGFASSDNGELVDLPFDASTVASSVFSALAGARSTLLDGPTAAGSPIDKVKTADLEYVIPIATAVDSELYWYMRCDPDAPTPYLQIKKSVGLQSLMQNQTVNASQGSITRTDTTVTIRIAAAALAQLPSANIACELREVTSASVQKSRHECTMSLRHSAGRVA